MTGFGEYKEKKRKNQPFSIQGLGKTLYKKAKNFHKAGDIKNAEKSYKEAINAGYINYNLALNLGRICASTGKTGEAINHFTKALELEPNQIQPYNELAGLYIYTEDLNKALSLSLKSTELNPNDNVAYMHLGVIYLGMGDLDQALSSTLKSIKLKGNDPNTYINLGNIHRQMGNLRQAVSSILKSIDIKPNNATAYRHLGQIYLDASDLDKSLYSILKSIEIKSDDYRAYSILGVIQSQRGDLDQALISTLKSIDLKNDNANAYMSLGNIYKLLGYFDKALAATRKGFELKPHDPSSHYALARIQRNMGEIDRANASIQKALELDPHLPEALYESSLNIDNSESAKKLLTRIEETLQKSLTPRKVCMLKFAESHCFHKLKNFEYASRSLEEANTIKPTLINKGFKVQPLILKIKQINSELSSKKAIETAPSKPIKQIFIVGMPRSGTTLLSSILGTNPYTKDLGEANALPEAIKAYSKKELSSEEDELSQLYKEYIHTTLKPGDITIDKQLSNFMHSTYIAEQIKFSAIIHATRNPLDNILSILKANFSHSSRLCAYASSAEDSARVIIEHETLMMSLKKKYPQLIFDYNYDRLVINPQDELKRLIKWLEWEWTDEYLSFHKNKRVINTASVMQARKPINNKSLGGWRNYYTILEPARQLLIESNLFPPESLRIQ